LQIGHLDIDKLPEEWAALRGQTGGSGGGYTEVQVNYDIARRTAALLISRGVTVDLIPATVPPGYTADVFVAIHCDAVTNPNPSGFKLARYWNSAIPKTDDTLMNAIYNQYEAATFMRRDGSITEGMTDYYSFSGPYRNYAISKVTPGVIIELGFLTNANDRSVLINRADDVARGLANGIIVFLNQRPPLEQREKPINLSPAVEARLERTPVYDSPDGRVMAYVSGRQVFTNFTDNSTTYGVWLPVLDKGGYIKKSDAVIVSVPR
jgi:N-acetylmuramoyl-L-alanine amidase